jgi:hypothetical protein
VRKTRKPKSSLYNKIWTSPLFNSHLLTFFVSSFFHFVVSFFPACQLPTALCSPLYALRPTPYALFLIFSRFCFALSKLRCPLGKRSILACPFFFYETMAISFNCVKNTLKGVKYGCSDRFILKKQRIGGKDWKAWGQASSFFHTSPGDNSLS